MVTDKSSKALPLYEGKNLFFGSKEIELEREIPPDQFQSGICFGRKANVEAISSTNKIPTSKHRMQFNPPSRKFPSKPAGSTGTIANVSRPDTTSTNTYPERPSPYLLAGDAKFKQTCWTANW